MRSLIYGAGSIGTVLGAFLSKGGADIGLVSRNREHIEALRKNGARITGTVDMTVPVNAYLPSEITGKFDVIILLTKSLENSAVAAFLKDFLTEDGVVVTMQNGLPEPGIAKVIGPSHTMGCAVEWGAMLVSPGTVRLTSSPDSLSFHTGKTEGITGSQFEKVKSLLEMMCPVIVEDDFTGARWSKLLINATFSGLATVMGGTFGDVTTDPVGKRVAVAAMKECIDVARASGIRFAPVQGKDITKLFYYRGPVKRAFALAILPLAMKKHSGIVPSMLQDIRNGKPCEVDAINGAVCDKGDETGVPTPVNDLIRTMIKEFEKGKTEPGHDNIYAFDDII